MADQKPVEASPAEMKHAEELWVHFIKAGKLTVVLCSLILLGLAAAFVPFS
jgi:hypothetical protein